MRLYGLIGYPLEHSFSKKYFDEKFSQEGLGDCRFENFPIARVDELPQILSLYKELKGLAVTIPYKKAVLPFLHDVSFLPKGLDACNCLKIQQGKLTGYNTDVIGFEKSLQPLLRSSHKNALILGNGGAAQAVKKGLENLGISFKIVNRQLGDDVSFTYDNLQKEEIASASIIINTTPLGMHPHIDSFPPIAYEHITAHHILYDLVYNPAETIFLKNGKEKGAVIKNGYEMLVLQAEENWRIWNS